MQRFRSEDGYLGYIGIIAALVIVAILMTSSVGLVGGSGSGASGAATDAAAQAEVQHAFSALQRCARKPGGSYATCNLDQVIENEPKLIPARGHLDVVASSGGAQLTSKSSSGNEFTITLNAGAVTRSCVKPGVSPCPASGRW